MGVRMARFTLDNKRIAAVLEEIDMTFVHVEIRIHARAAFMYLLLGGMDQFRDAMQSLQPQDAAGMVRLFRRHGMDHSGTLGAIRIEAAPWNVPTPEQITVAVSELRGIYRKSVDTFRIAETYLRRVLVDGPHCDERDVPDHVRRTVRLTCLVHDLLIGTRQRSVISL